MKVYEKSSGIVGMTSKNDFKINLYLIYAGSWCEIYGRLERSYWKGSLEEALLLDLYSINKRGNEKHSNREIRVCHFRI